jgi:group I intron endonuclease
MQTNNNKNKNIIPLASYYNIYTNKHIILNENRKKSGIYRLNNLITNKSYVGSSICLSDRFNHYYSAGLLKIILSKGSSGICSALLKYGYSKFSLDILEYCEIDVLIEREQHYIDLLKPEYNILKIAGSRLGSKHS